MEAKMYILYKAETTVPRSEAEDGLLQPGDISERAGDRYILNAFDRREDALAALKHLLPPLHQKPLQKSNQMNPAIFSVYPVNTTCY